MRAKLRAALLVLIGLLYGLSIPWYRETWIVTDDLLGLPGWVTVALGCYAGVALCNSLAWLLTDIPEAAPDAPQERS